MSKNQAVKDLRHFFENKRREVVIPGRLVHYLHHETNKRHDIPTITVALELMERRGEVMLERAGKVINKVTYYEKPEPKSEPARPTLNLTPIPVPPKPEKIKPPATTDAWSSLSKRERQLTRGMPDYLDNSQCSEVSVTKIPQPPVELEESSNGKSRLRVTPELLEQALTALRAASDRDGVLQAGSGIEVLKKAMGLQRNHANYLYTILGRLQLKVSDREGGKWRTLVEMRPEATVITEERIKEVVTGSYGFKTLQDSVGSEELEPEAEAITELEAEAEEESQQLETADDIIQRMVDIVEDIEAKSAAKDRVIEELKMTNATLAARCQELGEENMALREQMQQKTLISSRVVDVLQRYQT